MPSLRRTTVLSILLAGALAVSCGGGGTTSPPDPPTDGNPFDGTGIIGPAGGTVSLGEGVSLEIPAGALDQNVEITITRVATPADLQAAGAIGQAYRIAPVDLVLSPPARVSIFVPDAVIAGRPLAALTILRSTAGGGGDLVPAADELGGVQRTGGAIVSGTTTRFGTFSAAATEPPNQAPTADAGPNQTVNVGQSVTLAGSGSDPDGDPVSFSWAFQSRPSGSNATLSNASTASPTFTPDVAGSYVIVLTVSDGQGATATDTVTVTANQPPAGTVIANAGPDQTADVGQTVTLDGRGSTGDNLTYSWRFVSTPGGTPTLNNPTTPRPSFVPGAAGEYLVELTVADGSASDRDTVRVTVGQPNRAPTVSVTGPTAVLLGTQVTVQATASDPDGDAVSLTFTLNAPGGSTATLEVSGNQASFTPDVPGTYTVLVTASDGSAQSTAAAAVLGNLNVAGNYDTTFATTSVSSGCGDFVSEGETTDTMQVIQDPNDPSRVTLNLTEITSNIKNNPIGMLQGGQFTFNGTIRVGNDETTLNASGTINGTFTAAGEMNLTFSFSVLTCSVSGTITGQRI